MPSSSGIRMSSTMRSGGLAANSSSAARPAAASTVDSPAFKIWFVAALLLLMLIPMYFLNGLTQDRAANQENALAEYRKSWGPGQTVLGPIWIVPYVTAAGAQRQYLQIAPQRLKLAA